MHVVITGGTGLVGSQVDALLQERGDNVTIVSRSPQGANQIGWEPTRIGSLALPATTDAVIHLAGAPIVGKRWTSSYKEEIRESRVQGTRSVVKAIEEHGAVRHLVSASAVGYYGDRGEEELVEGSDSGEDFLADVCRAWEHEAGKARPRSENEPGCSVTVARMGIVLSAKDGALAEMLNPFWFVRPFHWGLGGKLGDGEQWFPWIHAQDAARAIVHGLDKQVDGALNVTAPNPVRNEAFIDALGSVLNRPTWLPMPKVALWLLYGEAADLLYASQRVVPARLQETGFSFKHPRVEPALADLLREG